MGIGCNNGNGMGMKTWEWVEMRIAFHSHAHLYSKLITFAEATKVDLVVDGAHYTVISGSILSSVV
jgi:hypothetical protein